MPDNSAPRPSLERWLALLVRYWAFNMSLIHDQGTNWPGFGYTPDEKTQLQSIARPVPGTEYLVWLALTVILFMLILTVVVIAGMSSLPPQAAAPLFFLQLGLDLIQCAADPAVQGGDKSADGEAVLALGFRAVSVVSRCTGE